MRSNHAWTRAILMAAVLFLLLLLPLFVIEAVATEGELAQASLSQVEMSPTGAMAAGQPAVLNAFGERAVAPLAVTAIGPSANAVGVALTAPITATFDDDLDMSTVSSSTVVVHGQMRGLMTGTFSYDSPSKTLTFTPQQPFKPGETIAVTLNDGILATDDTPLPPYQWQFTAGLTTPRCVGGFSHIEAGLTGVHGSSVAWGDYDKDGDLDILLTGRNNSNTPVAKVYRNENNIFNDISANLTGVSYSSVAWGDYDNDGDLDILLTGYNSGLVSKVYRNDNGTFNEISTNLTGVYHSSVAWGDYDNDGDLDILLTGWTGSTPVTKVYRNDNGTFSDISANLTGVYYSSVAWGDYDNDGDLDILLTGAVSSSASVAKVYRNDNGAFSDISANLRGVGRSSVAWGDYDNDGDLDILLTGSTGSTNVAKVYRNDNGIFNDISANLTGVNWSSVAWGDYDNDGDLDILLTGRDNSSGPVAKVYRNQNGSFNEISANLTAVWDGSVAWGDYDNDGDLDILLTGFGISKVYRNEACLSITLPSGALEYTENDPATIIDDAATVTDTDSADFDTGTLTVDYEANGTADDRLEIRHQGTGSGQIGVTSDTITFAGTPIGSKTGGSGTTPFVITFNSNSSATSAQALVRNLTYHNVSDTLSTTPRILRMVLTDGDGSTSEPITKTINVIAVNDLPIGADERITTTENMSYTFGVHDFTFFDVEGDTFHGIRIESVETAGDLQADGNDVSVGQVITDVTQLVFTPAPNAHGSPYASFTFKVRDSSGGESADTYTMTINVTAVNDLPTTTEPAANAVGVPLSALIKVTFEDDLDDSTASDNTFVVHGSMSGVMAGTYTYDGSTRTLTFDPQEPFKPGEVIRVTLNDGLLATNGSPLPPYQWQFTAGLTTARCVGGFRDIETNLTGVREGSVAWGDYDNDGDLDILLTGWDNGRTPVAKVYRNDNGDFSDISANLTGVYYSSVAWGDYDNDGDLDILLTGRDSSNTAVAKVYRNDNGTFQDISAGLTNVYDGSVAWGDYDNDGDLDILLTGSGISKVYRNDNGTFSDISANLTGVYWSSVAWGDYDNDGDLDILLTGRYGSTPVSKVYRNENGTFNEIEANLTNVHVSFVAWGDYDNDGDLDILLTGRDNSGSGVTKLYGNENGTFSDISAGLTDVDESSVAWGDYDNDGDLDILLTGYNSGSGVAKVYRNENGIFSDIEANLTGVYHSSVAWGDYDNDGDLDILLTGYHRVAKVYRNEACVTVTLPGGALQYRENDPATIIDAEATVSDDDSADFDTGTLTVDYEANGTANDRLDIRHQGTGAGQIGVTNNTITFAGTPIATFTGGSGTTPLVITFNSNSSPASAQALIRQLTYHNVSNRPSTTPRTLRMVLTDGDGSTSVPVSKTINVIAVDDSPTDVSISGPETGDIDTDYTFTATVVPPSTELPITYTWQATGQAPIIRTTNSLNDAVSWNWQINGLKTITVIAANSSDSVTASHQIRIGNIAPEARDVSIDAAELNEQSGLPKAGSAITVRYSYHDPDGDASSEEGTLIRWTRGDQFEQQEQPRFNEQTSIPSDITIAQERWCVTVTPRDGQDYGQPSSEVCTYIDNVPNLLPIAEGTISEELTSSDPLTFTYTYDDPDGSNRGQERGEVRIYRDGVLQPEFNNEESIPAEQTNPGEVWCGVVRPYDDEGFGPISEPKCTIISPAEGFLPQINAEIHPKTPSDDQELTIHTWPIGSLDTRDQESAQLACDESTLDIRWYREGQLQRNLNDRCSVSSDLTQPGDEWWAIVRPKNQFGAGRLVLITPVYILASESDPDNTPPVAREVKITPAHPEDDETLFLNYEYFDADGDAEGDTLIRWYKDLQHIALYDQLTVIPSGETSVGEVWHAVVIPNDGKVDGDQVAADSVLIGASNSPPEVLIAYLSPGNPGDEQNLKLRYRYYDADGDLEGDSEIRWTANGDPEAAYNNRTLIPHAATTVGDEWCAYVTPYDYKKIGGQFVSDKGDEVASNCVTIQNVGQNSAPEARDPHIAPAHPTSGDDLELKYDYFDADGDPEVETIIFWYRNGVLQREFDNQSFVPASQTAAGEVWYAVVLVHDGTDYGSKLTTPAVTINKAPKITEAYLSPSPATQDQDLIVEYDYVDEDRDPDSSKILWYKNDSYQPEYNNRRTIPHQALTAGQVWYAVVTASDGYEETDVITTTETTIWCSEDGEWCLYLPLILRGPEVLTPTPTPSASPTPTFTPTPTPTSTPSPPIGAEPNNSQETAQGPLISDQYYDAYPDDLDDWYYFVITQTSSAEVEVRNYRADGQVVLYKEYFDRDNRPQREVIASDGRELVNMEIPNEIDPDALSNLSPGRYLVRIYTVAGYREDELYRLKARYGFR